MMLVDRLFAADPAYLQARRRGWVAAGLSFGSLSWISPTGLRMVCQGTILRQVCQSCRSAAILSSATATHSSSSPSLPLSRCRGTVP